MSIVKSNLQGATCLLLSGDTMAVTSDANRLLGVAALTWWLALQHLAVLCDAVTVTLWNITATGNVVLGWGPCKVITTDLNVVVCELAELVVIHTEEFRLFRSTELQAWNLVDGEGEQSGHDECVRGAGNDVGNLHVHLLPVVIGPATGEETGVDAVETDDAGGGEEAVEEETNHTSDAVLSEHVEGIVDADPELDCVID